MSTAAAVDIAGARGQRRRHPDEMVTNLCFVRSIFRMTCRMWQKDNRRRLEAAGFISQITWIAAVDSS
ncbi:hypothetical protein AWC07_23960 [Mycobacterium gastri]|uniref:Uncharacterized protein n=1 Tax=Mycobacterium gastri TaxID=1777 RepID=A0A1X1VXZ4_MYCGS|nr:hypothetical protein AWC07_23960 [Mycobacterium gastri]